MPVVIATVLQTSDESIRERDDALLLYAWDAFSHGCELIVATAQLLQVSKQMTRIASRKQDENVHVVMEQHRSPLARDSAWSPGMRGSTWSPALRGSTGAPAARTSAMVPARAMLSDDI